MHTGPLDHRHAGAPEQVFDCSGGRRMRRQIHPVHTDEGSRCGRGADDHLDRRRQRSARTPEAPRAGNSSTTGRPTLPVATVTRVFTAASRRTPQGFHSRVTTGLLIEPIP
jgi:hypothetical protein